MTASYSRTAALNGEGTAAGAVAPATVPVAFQTATTPSGTSNSFNPSISRTITTTATTATGLCGIAAAALYASNSSTGTPYATWGGNNMTELIRYTDATRTVVIFGILNPPTGAQSVVIGTTGGSNAGREIVAMTSVYTNVGSFGTTTGNSTTTATITSASNEMVVCVGGSTGTSISGFNQTTRGGPTLSGGGSNLRGIFGDATGASPDVTFSATGIQRIALARLLPA